jgi:hypothetical protein
MKLLTKAIENKMPKLYSTENIDTNDKKIVCKFFALGSNWTWYVVEGERQENGDYLFFGLVDGLEKEWGYFSLSELDSVRWMGIQGIERDMHFDPVKVKNCSELRPRLSLCYVNPAEVMMNNKEEK